MARPTRLTDEIEDAICTNIVAGCPKNVASESVGVPHDTVLEWVERGEGRHKTRPASPRYVQFARKYRQAEHECQQRLIQIIAEAALSSWSAAAWMLERKYPDEWGRKDSITLKGDPNAPIKVGLDIERRLIERDPITGAAIITALPPAKIDDGKAEP